MDFPELVNARHSVRAYDPRRPVPRELIEECLRSAHLAPSACNSQPWRFVVVDEADKLAVLRRKVLGGLVANRWAADAPVIVVLSAEREIGTARMGELFKDIPYHLMDCGSAGEHFILRAVELGLGSCWIGWFRDKALRKLLGIPRRWKNLALISLGYPAADWEPRERRRRPLSEVAFLNDAGAVWPGV